MRRIPRSLETIIGIVLIVVSIGCDRASKAVAPVDQEKMPDVTLVREESTAASILRFNYKIKGRRYRSDTEDGLFSTITDPEIGMTILDHTNKTYRTFHLNVPENNGMSPEIAAKIASSVEMRYTGKKEIIGNWNCEEFVLFDSFGKGLPDELKFRCVGWITNDLEGGAAIQARREDMDVPSKLEKWMAATTSRKIAFPGFSVRTVTRRSGQYPVTITCLKVSYDGIDPKDFEVPSGYTDIPPRKNPNKPLHDNPY